MTCVLCWCFYVFGKVPWSNVFHNSFGRAFRMVHEQGWPELYVYGRNTVFMAGKSPNIRSYTVYTHGSDQPYAGALVQHLSLRHDGSHQQSLLLLLFTCLYPNQNARTPRPVLPLPWHTELHSKLAFSAGASVALAQICPHKSAHAPRSWMRVTPCCTAPRT
jgi:hypothetical protein